MRTPASSPSSECASCRQQGHTGYKTAETKSSSSLLEVPANAGCLYAGCKVVVVVVAV